MTITFVDGKQYSSVSVPSRPDSHEHETVRMDDSALTDGQLLLRANPPPNDKYIWVKRGNDTVYQVQKDGVVVCEALQSNTGIETLNDAAIAHKYSNNTGILRVGRQPYIDGDASYNTLGLKDGIHHERTIDGQLHVFKQQLHPSQPKLEISGDTDSGVDWLKIKDSLGDVFSVHDDGTVETRAWKSTDYEHPDQHASSIATGGQSVYIGKLKLSEDDRHLKIQTLNEPPYIPERLKHSPYDLDTRPLSEFNPGTDRSINDWMVVARGFLSETNAKLLRIRDVFPQANESADFAMNLNFPQKVGNKIRIQADVVKSLSLEAADNSVWLGERLHVNYDTVGKKAQLLTRKEVIPKYLVDRGVVIGDVTALGATLSTLTLDNCRTLSENSGGSTSVSDIFPSTNRDDDFETSTTFNEISVKSNHPGQQSGVEIENLSSHPIVNFKGSSNGRGLIQFNEGGVSKGVIYSSGASNALRIESVGEKTIIEHNLELSGDDIIVKSGKTFKYEGGTDLQTQINNLDNLYSTDTERVNAVNTLVTNYTSADTTLQNTLETALGKLSNTPTTIWVDANRSDSYTESGSRSEPYKTLNAALSGKLTDGATTSYVFRLLPGVYTGGVSIDHTSKTQSFKIEGSGRDITILESASSFASGKDTNVLFLRDFVSIEISDLTIRNGLYGFYPRSVDRVVCERVKFVNLGSAGTVNRHDQTGTQAEQAAYWASTSTSSGGACRIRDVGQLQMADCEVEYCLRGLRVQDVGSLTTSSSITNCRTFRTSEAGIYLASGTYTGAEGCINLTISGCTVCESFNNGILVIGGQYCAVQGCTVLRSANAGIQGWHSLDLTIADNTLMDCNRKTYNGIGNLADAWANCEVAGNSAIGTGTYMAVIKGNTISNGGQGRAASVIGFSIQRTGGAFPAASNKFVLESNVSDCATRLSNSQSIPRTKGDFRTRIESLESESLSFGTVAETGKVVYSENIKSYGDANWAGGGVSNPLELESTSASTNCKLELKNTANNGKCELVVSNLTHHDRKWFFRNKNADELSFYTDEGQYGSDEAFRISKGGNFMVVGANIAQPNEVGSFNFRCMGSTLFEHDKFMCTSLPTSDPGITNRIYNDNNNLKISSGTADEPVIRSTSHETPGGYTNWLQLPYSCKVLSIEQAQTCRRRLPLNPSDGHEITVIFPLGTGTLNLHTGAHVNSGVYRQMFYKSTGYASQYQVNINATTAGDMYKCVFIEAVNKWFLK